MRFVVDSVFRSRAVAIIGIVYATALFVIALFLLISQTGDSTFTDLTFPILLVVISGMSVAFSSAFFFRAVKASDSSVGFTVAVAGNRRVGKTVFVNVLFQRLMEGESRTLQFTADARTAQAAYQAIRNLGRGQWPISTPTGELQRYRGEIAFPPTGIDALFSSRPRAIKLEIGDSAGELWEDLSTLAESSDLDEKTRQLNESTFFEYVSQSNAMIYFIDGLSMKFEADTVVDSLQDLRATFQLLRSISPAAQRGRKYRAPITLVISKSDMLSDFELEMLVNAKRSLEADLDAKQMLRSSLRESGAVISGEFIRSLSELVSVVTILARQCEFFNLKTVSSIATYKTEESNQSFEAIQESAIMNYIVNNPVVVSRDFSNIPGRLPNREWIDSPEDVLSQLIAQGIQSTRILRPGSM